MNYYSKKCSLNLGGGGVDGEEGLILVYRQEGKEYQDLRGILKFLFWEYFCMLIVLFEEENLGGSRFGVSQQGLDVEFVE